MLGVIFLLPALPVMTFSRKFRIVNVFAETPLGGNPLCVFEDGEGLDASTMQALALQFNLSETTFILNASVPTATRCVRIFTPTFEMPFAGHPTLGTAHVVRVLTGLGDAVHLQMQAGIIPVHAQGDRWTLQAGAPTWHDSGRTRAEIAVMLGIDESDVRDGDLWVDTGSEQWVIPLASPEAVARCRPVAADLARYSVGSKRRGLAYVWAPVDDRSIRVRFFLDRLGASSKILHRVCLCKSRWVVNCAWIDIAVVVRGTTGGSSRASLPVGIGRGRTAAHLCLGAGDRDRSRRNPAAGGAVRLTTFCRRVEPRHMHIQS